MSYRSHWLKNFVRFECKLFGSVWKTLRIWRLVLYSFETLTLFAKWFELCKSACNAFETWNCLWSGLDSTKVIATLLQVEEIEKWVSKQQKFIWQVLLFTRSILHFFDFCNNATLIILSLTCILYSGSSNVHKKYLDPWLDGAKFQLRALQKSLQHS